MKVFISYSRIDAKDTANVIHEYLTNYGYHEVFIDTSNIHGGDEWWNTIQNAISNCDIFIIIVTPSALYRSEVEKEVDLAKNLKKKIIPCIAKDYVDENEIKWELNKYQGFFYERDAKLAMDLHMMIKRGAKNQKIHSDIKHEIERSNPYSISEKQSIAKITSVQGYLEKAKVFQRLKQYQRALKNYDEVIKLDNDNFEANFKKANLLYDIGDFNNALDTIEKSIDLQPEHPDVWYNKGIILEKLEQYDEALEALDSDLEIDNTDKHSLATKGNILLKLKRYEKAINVYNDILKLDPDNIDAKQNKEEAIKELKTQEFSSLINEIKSKMQNKEYSEVIELCEKVKEIELNKYYPYLYQGNALQELNRPEEAIKYYEQALKIDSTNLESLNNKGLALYKLGKYQEAIDCYDKVLSIDVNNNEAIKNIKIVKQERRLYFIDKIKKSYYEYITINRIIELNILFNKALNLHNNGKYEDALKYYNKILTVDANNKEAMKNIKIVLEKIKQEKYFSIVEELKLSLINKDYHKVFILSEKALELEPKNSTIYLFKAQAFSQIQKYKEAIECYNKALTIDPNNIDIKQNKELAIKELKKQKYSALINAIESQYKRKNYWDVVNLSNIAIEENSTNYLGYLYKGKSLQELARFKEAIQAYDRVLNLDPKNTDALNNRKKLSAKIL